MDIPSVRTALKAALEPIEGLNVDDLNENPEVPCAIVFPDVPLVFDLDFAADGEALQMPEFCVLLLVSYTDVADAQAQLDAYLSTSGPTSVKAAIAEDHTLGGVVSSAEVTELRSYEVMQLADGGIRYLSATLIVEVYV